jgi:hypothetical protein
MLFQKRVVHTNLIYICFYYYTSVGRQLVPEDIIPPAISVSALTWIFGYTCAYIIEIFSS